ncbi:phosphoribosylformylglycinamidine synthase subunit PurQ [Balneolaceae bacterium ANBcel3]|nr:phosphoribosylformylglycinamidine synthase subunit PurQ [Balneolaceae bacterium ANBcel3]
MKFGVLVFPGSNCDHDAYHALKHIHGTETRFIWHKESSLGDVDAVIVPGGFSYGDYLRSGAIARFSPVMNAVADFAAKGGPVLGICNGFQILLEARLLPGTMMANEHLRFTCKQVLLKTESHQTPFTSKVPENTLLEIPVAHGEGNYYAEKELLKELEDQDQIIFRYVNAQGDTVPEANPNGSVSNIAGICNKARNVVGMMPHPERAVEKSLGSEDGRYLFESVINHITYSL